MRESDKEFYTRKHDEACARDDYQLADYYSAQLKEQDMTDVFSNTQIPLLGFECPNVAEDDFLTARRRNESPLADILGAKEKEEKPA